MSIGQDEEIATFVSVNAALDAILFVADEHNETAISVFDKSSKCYCYANRITFMMVNNLELLFGHLEDIFVFELSHTCMSLFVLCNVLYFIPIKDTKEVIYLYKYIKETNVWRNYE